jgi:hypothetical protein
MNADNGCGQELKTGVVGLTGISTDKRPGNTNGDNNGCLQPSSRSMPDPA